MKRSIQCRRASHTNIVIENLDDSIKHFERVFGASFMLDLPGDAWHACLVEIGGFVIELFEPKGFLLNSRIGPHYLGIEYETNMEDARAAIADHGLRIIRDIGQAVHTDPSDGLGVAYEFFDGTFYGPNISFLKATTHSDEHWGKHPIGYAGFMGYTQAVSDIEAASAFLQDFLNAKPVYETVRAGLNAQAIGLKIANDICELLSPLGDGPLLQDMLKTGRGIRATRYRVKNIAQAREYFEGMGLRVIEGTVPGSIAVDPRDNLGVLFEFVETE